MEETGIPEERRGVSQLSDQEVLQIREVSIVTTWSRATLRREVA